MFGSTQPQQSTGFSFGQSNATATAPTAAKPAFSFGGSSTAPTTPATGNTGFSFGAKSATSTANTATAPSPGFSFGAKPALTTATTTGIAPTATTGFSFGAKPATTTTGLSLTTPSTVTTTAAQPTGFSFGNTNAGAALTTTTTAANTLTQPTTTTAAAPSISSQPSFAWSKPTTTSALTTSNTIQPLQSTQPIQTAIATTATPASTNLKDYTPTINDKLIKIKTSWDSTNPQCKMTTHLYNRVDPSFNNFTRPDNETPEEWENAMKNRPKEYNSIPIKCCGFNDLFERNKLQDNHVKQTRKLLNEINDKLIKLNEKHDLHSNNLLLKCKLKQKNLNLKLLKISINLSILKYKGYPLTNDEELLISNFNNLLSKLDDPLGLNRVNEIWARLSSLKDKYSNNIESDNNVPVEDDIENNDLVIKNLVKVLSKQQQGIQFLCELMEEDEKKLTSLVK